jgi:hypothetical protein
MEKGTFQATKPPNIYGNNRHLTKDTNYTISYDANIGKNKTMHLPGVMNSYKDRFNETILETPTDISYRLIENTLGLQFYRAKKYESGYLGYGYGVQNFPYVLLMAGINEEIIEIGGTAFWGFTVNKASYEGEWDIALDNIPNEDEWDGSPLSDKYIKIKDLYIPNSYVGAVGHVSFFWEKFALNYAISVSMPWSINKIPVSKDEEADLAISFPYLLMQDIGISYTPNKIKYRLGVNQITGDFPGHYRGLSVQVAYGW